MKKISPNDLNVNPIRQNNQNPFCDPPKAESNIFDGCETDPVRGCTTQKEHGCTYTEYTYSCPNTFDGNCENLSNNTQCICKTYTCPETGAACNPSNSAGPICCAPDTKEICIAQTNINQCASKEICLTSVEIACETEADNCHSAVLVCHITDDCGETSPCALSIQIECNETDIGNCDNSFNLDCTQHCLQTNNTLCNYTINDCETAQPCENTDTIDL